MGRKEQDSKECILDLSDMKALLKLHPFNDIQTAMSDETNKWTQLIKTLHRTQLHGKVLLI